MNEPIARRRSDARCAQPPERDADIGRERTDVGAAAALDEHGGLRVRPRLEVLDHEAIDVDATRLALDVDARARELVEPATADLHRRHHRWELLEVADEARRPRLPRRRAPVASVAARRSRPTRRACWSRCRTRSARDTTCPPPGGIATGAWRGRGRRAARRWHRDRACPRDRRGVASRPCAAWRRRRARCTLPACRRRRARLSSIRPSPICLATTRSRSAVERVAQARDEVVEVERGLEARGEPVAAPAVAGGDARSRRRHPANAGSRGRCRRALPSATQVTSASVVRRRMSMSPSTSSSVTP